MDLVPERSFTNDLYDSFMESRQKKNCEMKCDIYEKDGIYHVEMDIPGANKNDIKVEVEDGYLNINVTKENEVTDESKNYIKKERFFGKYERKFYVGDIDDSNIKADFKDGILHIEFPETKKQINRKRIEIK